MTAPVAPLDRLPPAPPAGDRSAPAAMPRKVDLFGVKVSITHYAEVTDILIARAAARQPAIVAFAPANIIVEAAADEAFRGRLNQFDMVCPDGQPVRWCLNHFHDAQLADRVYGPQTTLMLCSAAERDNLSIYLYGASPETIALLVAKLHERFPRLQIAGQESPPFRPLTPEEDAAVVERINASGAGLVFVGLGSIKQENFAFLHRQSITAVQLCVGAAFDFIAGTKKTAPAWMQRNGLEWLFRLASEPRRLLKRYAITNSQFVYYVIREKFRGKAAR